MSEMKVVKKKVMTPEERIESQREAVRKYRRKNKDKINQKRREMYSKRCQICEICGGKSGSRKHFKTKMHIKALNKLISFSDEEKTVLKRFMNLTEEQKKMVDFNCVVIS